MESWIIQNWFSLYINIVHQQQSILQKDFRSVKFSYRTCVRL